MFRILSVCRKFQSKRNLRTLIKINFLNANTGQSYRVIGHGVQERIEMRLERQMQDYLRDVSVRSTCK